MTTISAKRIKHSISAKGIELKTVLARYPRFIHAELMTHRVFSRNASSSRAIPVSRLIDDVLRDTAMPTHWGKNQKGMQAQEEHNHRIDMEYAGYFFESKIADIEYDGPDRLSNHDAWLLARDFAITMAKAFDAAGYHKQIVNRLLEPFAHINVLITSTEWDNFFELRDHKDAQPEIQLLAKAIKAAFEGSEPQALEPNEWHLPFIEDRDLDHHDIATLIKLSVARCARTSYLTHDGRTPDPKEDLALYERLVGSEPLHASPAEHQATPDIWYDQLNGWGSHWDSPRMHGNLTGWIQFRKLLEAA